ITSLHISGRCIKRTFSVLTNRLSLKKTVKTIVSIYNKSKKTNYPILGGRQIEENPVETPEGMEGNRLTPGSNQSSDLVCVVIVTNTAVTGQWQAGTGQPPSQHPCSSLCFSGLFNCQETSLSAASFEAVVFSSLQHDISFSSCSEHDISILFAVAGIK